MRTVQVEENGVSIWFSGEKPPARGQALALVRRALAERGRAPWPETVLELFDGGSDALLLARPGRGERRAFRFSSLEPLLWAAAALPGEGPAGGALYWDGGAYILVLDSAAPALYEFGTRWTPPPGWESFAREQGMCLAGEDAVRRLRCFGAM